MTSSTNLNPEIRTVQVVKGTSMLNYIKPQAYEAFLCQQLQEIID
jgi:hypothetical protein